MDMSIFLTRLKKAKRYDNYVAGVCPFHQDHSPSLLVYDDGWFVCLACDKRGTHDTLLRKLEGHEVEHNFVNQTTNKDLPPLPFLSEDREEFCDQAHNFLMENESVGWYLKVRGIDDRIERARIGWHNGWYVFPVFSPTDLFQGMILRASPYIQHHTGIRYYIPKGQPPLMYCPDWFLYRSQDYLFVVYGMIDALVLSGMRLPVVTTTSGKQTFKPSWIQDVRKPILIVPDEGEHMTAFKLVTQLGWRGAVIRLPYTDDCKDPADYIIHNKKDQLESLLLQGVNEWVNDTDTND